MTPSCRLHALDFSRREFLTSSIGLLAAARSSPKPPRILLRSSWQVVNIGDIAHTPGVLALLEKHLPNAEVRLWASGDLSAQVAAMEHKRFPNLRIVKGSINDQGKASTSSLQDAIDWCGFLLHGSGPSFVAHRDTAAFVKATKKPFGIYGITYGSSSSAEKELLGKARFVYFRDSVSLAKAKSDGIPCPAMEFAPDGAFAADLRDDAAATTYLKSESLEPGKFLCCIPRLRYTPYWTIPGRSTPFDAAKHKRNEAMKAHDAAPLLDAIVAVTEQTDLKILICPEDQTQMQVGKENLVDKLPRTSRSRVVWRDKFWLTDEALSVYVRSAGLFGHEMHSPIMCIGNGIPAIVCRWAEQTSKGFMWKDIGLGDWLFDLDDEKEHSRVAPAVLAMAKDPDQATRKARQAMAFVQKRQRETMTVVASHVAFASGQA